MHQTDNVSQYRFAKEHGVSRQYIHKLVKAGKIKTDAAGKINPTEARKHLAQHSDPARAGKIKSQVLPTLDEGSSEEIVNAPAGSASGRGSFQDARTRREIVNAHMAEMELAQRAGNLVEKRAVEKEVLRSFIALRESLQRLPHQMAGKLVTLKNERDVAAYVDQELNKVLSALADEMEKQSQCSPTPDNSLQGWSPAPFAPPQGSA